MPELPDAWKQNASSALGLSCSPLWLTWASRHGLLDCWGWEERCRTVQSLRREKSTFAFLLPLQHHPTPGHQRQFCFSKVWIYFTATQNTPNSVLCFPLFFFLISIFLLHRLHRCHCNAGNILLNVFTILPFPFLLDSCTCCMFLEF